MAASRSYQIKEVAGIAGVSVRTLHHYDAIGLLVPSARSGTGYRLYHDEDLLRLQQILIGRELGLSLDDIRRSLDDPTWDRRRALLAQRDELLRRADKTAEMIRAVELALEHIDRSDHRHEREHERTMNMKELFNGFDPSRYEAEAERRWGHTAAYKESARRTQGYGPEDWKRFGVEQASIMNDALALLNAGVPPDSPAAMAVAERHRLSIDQWFYPCSPSMHRGLSDLYENDARFAENIDKHGTGLTPFLVAAIRANSARAES
jgi:DNA-binding transcriptional MerR regulator